MQEKWKDLLEESRNNYLSVIQSLSKMQKEMEKLVISATENGISYQKDFSGILSDWVQMGNVLKEGMQTFFKNNMKQTFDALSFNLPFKAELENLYNSIQESFQKYFENLQNFTAPKKKE